ncbi:hypothetical protein J1N35_029469 [Gossypium stocksii]|uniref:Uncharacterized protein n=1 Tax=Gossypium stocksii TaxID=47602 RepID=A0A9D3UYZ3_9ROSI|nr:hypothetical protein J1N35_029469 [Gossypium stocksii]
MKPVEYSISDGYHAMFAYFDRDNVALEFKRQRNKRGGRVQLLEISLPLWEFYHGVKGHELHAMEFALSMEKIANARLLHLHRVD